MPPFPTPNRRPHGPLLLALPLLMAGWLLVHGVPCSAEPQQAAQQASKLQSSGATESAMVEATQESMMREFVTSPLFLPEAYSDFPQTVAPPIVGSLGVSVE